MLEKEAFVSFIDLHMSIYVYGRGRGGLNDGGQSDHPNIGNRREKTILPIAIVIGTAMKVFIQRISRFWKK